MNKMNKIILLLVVIFSMFSIFNITSYASNHCNYDIDSTESWTWYSVWDILDDCLSSSSLVNWNDLQISWKWFPLKIKNLVNNISLYLWILSVLAIVIGSLMMTLSTWEEEKIKKAKDIVKWWIIWFIWLISASAIINLVVKILYSL